MRQNQMHQHLTQLDACELYCRLVWDFKSGFGVHKISLIWFPSGVLVIMGESVVVWFVCTVCQLLVNLTGVNRQNEENYFDCYFLGTIVMPPLHTSFPVVPYYHTTTMHVFLINLGSRAVKNGQWLNPILMVPTTPKGLVTSKMTLNEKKFEL